MSRSGYSDACDGFALARYRGTVTRAIKGKRGQAFFRDLVAALDAMPVKALIAGALVADDGCACAMGVVCLARGVDARGLEIDQDDQDYGWAHDKLAAALDIAPSLVAEVANVNDEHGFRWNGKEMAGETPEERWARVRKWASDETVSER